jgi:dihydroorotase
MDYIAELGGVVAEHAEDPGLSRGGHIHEGPVSAELGMVGIPAEAEETVVARDLAIARLTGASYHVQHVSTAGTVALVRRAKADGLPVTAEVTPHHLFFDHEAALDTDSVFKMYPPLRRPEDVASVREALGDGTIDMVGTDHAPHASHEKDVPFEEAPRGVIGLETAVGAVITAVGLDAPDLFDRMSVAPARLAGFEDQGKLIAQGSPASIAVIDPEATHVVESFVSKSANSPFRGRTLSGVVRHTIFEGAITVRDGKVAG